MRRTYPAATPALLISGGEAILEDLGSRNGTFVRGGRPSSPARFGDGDEFRLVGVLHLPSRQDRGRLRDLRPMRRRTPAVRSVDTNDVLGLVPNDRVFLQ